MQHGNLGNNNQSRYKEIWLEASEFLIGHIKILQNILLLSISIAYVINAAKNERYNFQHKTSIISWKIYVCDRL